MASPTKRSVYKVGIIGAGRISQKVHIKNIIANPRLELLWIADEMASQLEAVKEMFNLQDVAFHLSSKVDDLLSSAELDAVFVFTPGNTHFDYIIRCLNKGKSVFVEKPIGRTQEEINMCYDAAENHKKVFLPGFMWRYDPCVKKLCEAVQSRSIGDIRTIRLCARGHPRAALPYFKQMSLTGESIILWDAMIHELDILGVLTDCQTPETVFAQGFTHDPELKLLNIHDTMVVQLKLRNGILVMMDAALGAFAFNMRMEVFGTKGQAYADNHRSTSTIIENEVGGMLSPPPYSYFTRFETSFKEEIKHFVDCLDGITVPCVTRKEALMCVNIAEKASRSLTEGRVINF